jgi:ribonuclease P protein component
MPVSSQTTLISIIAGRMIGNAVQRNRTKRLLREVLRSFLDEITPGYYLVVISRQGAQNATILEIRSALQCLLKRAKLLKAPHEN